MLCLTLPFWRSSFRLFLDLGPVEMALSKYSTMAGWVTASNSMSRKWPLMWPRNMRM